MSNEGESPADERTTSAATRSSPPSEALDRELEGRGTTAELCLGGTVMVLV